ncbi:MAG: NAD-dependent epimerase/dehydratase family protein [Desulfovibrionaceae bacterium]|jgi:nucleoside-diphosphate-sugar epimerase|nr:NAD-dependent epimerase/dehydratase family protein [Desulfovibrionaceae bacterium]
MHKALVLGAGGFIGAHLVRRLKAEGFWVRGVDLKHPPFAPTAADDFVVGDLRDPVLCREVMAAPQGAPFDEVYQLAADMGGAGYVFVGEHDAAIMHNSATINLNAVDAAAAAKVGRIFYSSSACIYPLRNQMDPDTPDCAEGTAYPASPDSDYGWEKLFSERLYLAYARNTGLQVRIARYHNIFGPEGSWNDGREKSPAALCRKVAEAEDGGEIEIWGDGLQTRSFLYIDECLEGSIRLMRSDFSGPVNIGSDEMVSIDQLAGIIMAAAGKPLALRHVDGPLGVRGRNSDNRLVFEKLGWRPTRPLAEGLAATYAWIADQVRAARA